jgi:prepilin-type N-terminal cleavage/methylation domain-containing protein
MIRDRRGWTMVELLIVMILLGLLAGIAVMKYIDLKHRALSATATADLESVRLAAYSVYYETGSFPPEAGSGTTPPLLMPYLPRSFSFDRPEYMLDWENLVTVEGAPSGGMQVGVVLTTSNPRLSQTLAQTLGDKSPFFMIGNTLTFVIVGPDGKI